jgi:molybdate transport system regulatory protein
MRCCGKGQKSATLCCMKAGNKQVGARLRIVLEPDIAIGPGKADILQGIKETGSIAAAGRRMGMSYKRAWLLVETMNRCFKTPLVETSRGGRRQGGANLTAAGEEVLARYRRMELLTRKAIAKEMRKLKSLLRDMAK